MCSFVAAEVKKVGCVGITAMAKVDKKIDIFDERSDSFESYLERFELYVSANDVTEGKKLAVFLTVLGPRV